MKTPTATILLSTLMLGGLATVSVGMQTSAGTRIREFISEGNLSLDLRARYETVDEDGSDTAHALTLRSAMGFMTRAWNGIQVMFGVENIATPFPDAYNQSQLNPDGRDKAIVTDPTGTNVVDAWMRYTHGKTSVTFGRQSFTLGNGRFIGQHDWRQNHQTFDSVLVRNESFKDLALTYGYIARVNRVFGQKHAQGVYDSNSHVFHAEYSRFAEGTISAYAYLLDFDGVAVGNSCATYGVSFAGERTAFEQFTVGYRAEYALQTDYGNNPLFYSANYLAVAGDVGTKDFRLGIGHEMFGTDNGFGFRTPLGSLHDFNGWSDQFLNTPAQGMRDTYIRAEGQLPWYGIGLAGASHKFTGDDGAKLGSEINLQANCLVTDSITATLKYASFKATSPAFDDTSKIWAQMHFVF